MEIRAYLRRIEYFGSLRPTINVLRRLHRQHLLTVPFENLDIHLGRPIRLDQKRFFKKIVEEQRGGYCYELNGCFAWLLKRLGFNVTMLSARVAGKNGGFSPEFDHMVLLVQLEERWLADVGFGDLFAEPKRIDLRKPQREDGKMFVISKNGQARLLSRKLEGQRSWSPQYSFRLKSHRLAEFASRNRYQQTSPKSHFTKGRIVSRLTSSGRVSLSDSKLTTTTDRIKVEHLVGSSAEFNRLLFKHFGIRLTKSTSEA